MTVVARVFPRRTRATPKDELAFVGDPPLWPVECDEVHVSCSFTWDASECLRIGKAWQAQGYRVCIGGPGLGCRAEEFVPGRYLAPGYVITSRGCPNKCWFCSVWRRDGGTRELPITEGWDVLDDNLLACSHDHIVAVGEMLDRQRHRPRFTGGLEAKRFDSWHAEWLVSLRPESAFFAFDTPDDWVPLVEAAMLCRSVGLLTGKHRIRAYVLCGYVGDTLEDAEARMRSVLDLGVLPMAMAFRNRNGRVKLEWRRFQRRWARPHLYMARQERQEYLPLLREAE